MPQYDGSIRINTKLDTKDVPSQLMKLENSMKKTADRIASLRSKMESLKDVKIPTQEYEDLQKELDKATKELEKMLAQDSKLSDIDTKIKRLTQSSAEYASKMREVAAQKIPTQEYTSLEKEWERLEKRLIKIGESRQRFLAGGGKEKDSSFRRMSYDMESIEQQMDSIASKMKKMEDSGKAFTLGTDTEQYKNLSAKYEQVNAELEKQKGIQSEIAGKQAESVQRVMEIKAQMQQLVEQGKDFTLGSDTEKYAEMSAQMEKLSQRMQSDTERQKELQDALAEREQRLIYIKANSTVLNQDIINLLERRKQLIAEISDMEQAGVGLGYKQYEDANRELEEINARVKDYKSSLSSVPEKFKNMRKSAKKAFDAVASGTKKSSGLLSTFGSRLKSLALSLLIFNWISKAFRAMISGMKDGFTNFMNYSDSFANSVQGMKNAISTLGNQFAAAFAPIVQMVIPWLNSLINAITAAMAKLAQFIALLTGASTFTRAKAIQDSYNKSLGGTASAAKKAFGALAKFDDLDVLQKKEDDTAGGGIEGTLPKDMFEEVPVDMNLPSWLDEILARLNELKDIFAQGFWDGLGDFEYRFKTIKDGISSIKDSLMDIWTDPAVQSASQGWTDSVAYMLGSLVGSLASIGLTIAANLIGGIEKYLSQNKNRIKKFLTEWFDVRAEINYLLAELFQSIAYVFEAFASEEGQQLTANLIGIFTDAFMGLELIIDKFTRDILNLFIQPFVDNKEEFRTALEGFLGVLAEVTGTIKQGIDDTFDKFNEVYDAHFKPFFDSVAEGLSELTAHFLDFWNGYVQPILDSWAEKFDVLWTEHIQPVIDGLLEMFGSFVELLTIFWEETLQPLIDWMIEVFGPTFANIWDNAYSSVNNAITFMADKINGIIKIVRGVIDILIGIAKGDWKKVWDGFAEVVDGFKTIIKGIVNSVIGIVESLANSVVTAINTVIRALNSLHIDVPGWVTDLTGITDFGFNLSEIGKVNIPRLANGSVIRGGNPFMAILGDQPAGQTNIEAPLSTIEQGLENVLNRRGGYNENISNLSGLQAKLVLNINGMDVGEAVIDDLLAVMQRRGLDVQVLGASI